MVGEIKWRFLVVDDKHANDIEEFITAHPVLDAPNIITVEKCTRFSEAIEMLSKSKVDLVILDLKDDSIELEDEDKPLPGESVFSQIQQTRFVPIVFYTAYAFKINGLENPYVRVVTRGGDPRALHKAIKEVFDTGLPQLTRHIDEEQRKFMWEQVQNHWKESRSSFDNTDLSYLLARRLANILERNSIRRFLTEQGAIEPSEDDPTIYPIEMYIYPPTNSQIMGGDILFGKFFGKEGHWIVLTPSCDLVQGKVANVILAECYLLSEQHEYKKVEECINNGIDPSKSIMKDLENLVRNRRNANYENGKNYQPNRYAFLPETFFLPALVIDFLGIGHVPLQEITQDKCIASLDSPFAEAYLAKFSDYYGRIGTPDINTEQVIKRIIDNLQKEKSKVLA